MAAKDMDWTYPAGAGDSGIFQIGRRLAEALGRAPDSTRFTYDPRAMLRTTRDIERASTGGRLLVGFQAAAKFDVEADLYRALLAAGTQVTAWAAGQHAETHGLEDLDYRALPAGTRRLENQWFLVTDSPEPLAFVSVGFFRARIGLNRHCAADWFTRGRSGLARWHRGRTAHHRHRGRAAADPGSRGTGPATRSWRASGLPSPSTSRGLAATCEGAQPLERTLCWSSATGSRSPAPRLWGSG